MELGFLDGRCERSQPVFSLGPGFQRQIRDCAPTMPGQTLYIFNVKLNKNEKLFADREQCRQEGGADGVGRERGREH